MTHEEKGIAVRAALNNPVFNRMSNYQIARFCGVSESTVRNYKEGRGHGSVPRTSRADISYVMNPDPHYYEPRPLSTGSAWSAVDDAYLGRGRGGRVEIGNRTRIGRAE